MNTIETVNTQKNEKPEDQDLEMLTKNLIDDKLDLEDYISAISKIREPSILSSYDYRTRGFTRDTALRVSQERMERKIDELIGVVATREDVVEQVNQLLQYQQEANTVLQEKIEILRLMQAANVPHKRLARYASAFLTFFIFSFVSDLFFNVTIVTRFWNNLGIFISFGFLLMAFAMGIDWQEHLKKK